MVRFSEVVGCDADVVVFFWLTRGGIALGEGQISGLSTKMPRKYPAQDWPKSQSKILKGRSLLDILRRGRCNDTCQKKKKKPRRSEERKE